MTGQIRQDVRTREESAERVNVKRGKCGMRHRPVSWRKARPLAGPGDSPSLLQGFPCNSAAGWWRWCQDGWAKGWRDISWVLGHSSTVNDRSSLVGLVSWFSLRVRRRLDLTCAVGFPYRSEFLNAINKPLTRTAINILCWYWIPLKLSGDLSPEWAYIVFLPEYNSVRVTFDFLKQSVRPDL